MKFTIFGITLVSLQDEYSSIMSGITTTMDKLKDLNEKTNTKTKEVESKISLLEAEKEGLLELSKRSNKIIEKIEKFLE